MAVATQPGAVSHAVHKFSTVTREGLNNSPPLCAGRIHADPVTLRGLKWVLSGLRGRGQNRTAGVGRCGDGGIGSARLQLYRGLQTRRVRPRLGPDSAWSEPYSGAVCSHAPTRSLQDTPKHSAPLPGSLPQQQH
ncbi:hypothetical protein AAFF_G00301640 [Aldrovandia affinis]|uniref:Uncharacterized protein n=1 Tax=Aldrovandia affinis TaxID=143900 RepID=A0AAD7WRQ7_9TELE|nr:hypothetical protein AAFF_G00301640 [Aldrovandia affinis]